ncbi:hypothetical protein [Streptomyces sp. NPDC006551]|uniref:hypothetical protein n=1 Tax=Streptomyces sp. NPDC006551 TaxID=3157178 RepID=UPI0033B47087
MTEQQTERQADLKVPAEDAAPAEAPIPAAPETSEAVAPEAAAPEAVAPEAVAPEAAAPEAAASEEPEAVPAPKISRRPLLWAVARWGAAVLVCGGLGAGTAFGITSMERTDVPGLATESDGRWAYPRLSLPALPAGVPRPFTDGNDGEIHHADLRKLLLPAPAGATADPKLDGGWVSVDQYLSLYGEDHRTELKQTLADSALRHIAARGWTMPDGTATQVHLLRFKSVAFAEAFKHDTLKTGLPDSPALVGVEGVQVDGDTLEDVDVLFTTAYSYVELPADAEQSRWAYVQAGDTLAVVTQSRKGEALAVPFQQTVTLQSQLLG